MPSTKTLVARLASSLPNSSRNASQHRWVSTPLDSRISSLLRYGSRVLNERRSILFNDRATVVPRVAVTLPNDRRNTAISESILSIREFSFTDKNPAGNMDAPKIRKKKTFPYSKPTMNPSTRPAGTNQ